MKETTFEKAMMLLKCSMLKGKDRLVVVQGPNEGFVRMNIMDAIELGNGYWF